MQQNTKVMVNMFSEVLNRVSDAVDVFADKFEYIYVGSGARNESNPPNDYDIFIVPKDDATEPEYEQVLNLIKGKTSSGKRIDAYIVPEFYEASKYLSNVPVLIYGLNKKRKLNKLKSKLMKPKHIKIGFKYPKQISWIRIA